MIPICIYLQIDIYLYGKACDALHACVCMEFTYKTRSNVPRVTAQSLCNILEQAYQCTIILRSHWSCLYTIYYMSNMILLCHAYVICYVSERSAALHAYLNPFVHTRTISPKDTIRDYLIFEYCSEMSSGLLSCITISSHLN